MKDTILSFIKRRFPQDCNWTTGNCYFFAQILHLTFGGDIYYDPIDGHFLCLIDNNFYDWTGLKNYSQEEINLFYKWNELFSIDPIYYNRIIRDCCL